MTKLEKKLAEKMTEGLMRHTLKICDKPNYNKKNSIENLNPKTLSNILTILK